MENNETIKEINDINELKSIQRELVNRDDSQYQKTNLPKGAKLKKIRLTKYMAICLVFVYKHYRYTEGVKETDYFPKKVLMQYLSDFPNITSQFVRLKYWDLICQMPTSPTEIKYKKGWYGITENGIKFIQKEIGLPKYAFVFNDIAYEHQTNPYFMINDLIEDSLLDELIEP
jgi:hypothetical protein